MHQKVKQATTTDLAITAYLHSWCMTEKSYEPFERNVNYILTTKSSHATSLASKSRGSLQSGWTSAETACKCFTASILALI